MKLTRALHMSISKLTQDSPNIISSFSRHKKHFKSTNNNSKSYKRQYAYYDMLSNVSLSILIKTYKRCLPNRHNK